MYRLYIHVYIIGIIITITYILFLIYSLLTPCGLAARETTAAAAAAAAVAVGSRREKCI